MQQKNARRSNQERTDATRAELIAAARALFTGKGYAATGTPEIVSTAGVTRGALYHHFADKQALLRAVVEQEAAAVAAEIENATPDDPTDAIAALRAGAHAYLQAMRAPGRARLLLLDGPAALGRDGMDQIDAAHGNRTLREGLTLTMRAGAIAPMPLGPLTTLLGAMFDRAALAIEQGEPADDYLAIMDAVLAGLGRAGR